MIIPEGSRIKIIVGSDTLEDEIIANEDIEIERTGYGYTILLRVEGYDTNNIFETDRITKIDDENYVMQGYFKDALLVLRQGQYTSLFKSYMEF